MLCAALVSRPPRSGVAVVSSLAIRSGLPPATAAVISASSASVLQRFDADRGVHQQHAIGDLGNLVEMVAADEDLGPLPHATDESVVSRITYAEHRRDINGDATQDGIAEKGASHTYCRARRPSVIADMMTRTTTATRTRFTII